MYRKHEITTYTFHCIVIKNPMYHGVREFLIAQVQGGHGEEENDEDSLRLRVERA